MRIFKAVKKKKMDMIGILLPMILQLNNIKKNIIYSQDYFVYVYICAYTKKREQK